ncbi:hypothetical protein [Methylomonas albis]|nr:hypothetical protein [Methylomonas albis]
MIAVISADNLQKGIFRVPFLVVPVDSADRHEAGTHLLIPAWL